MEKSAPPFQLMVSCRRVRTGLRSADGRSRQSLSHDREHHRCPHQQAGRDVGAKDLAMGRPRGGLKTINHLLAATLCWPLHITVTTGQAGDIIQTPASPVGAELLYRRPVRGRSSSRTLCSNGDRTKHRSRFAKRYDINAVNTEWSWDASPMPWLAFLLWLRTSTLIFRRRCPRQKSRARSHSGSSGERNDRGKNGWRPSGRYQFEIRTRASESLLKIDILMLSERPL